MAGCEATVRVLETGEAFSLKTPCTSIGREEYNDLVLESPSVSRKHAEIWSDHASWFIQDLNAPNGIEVNGYRLCPGERYPLRNKSRILLASTELLFELPDDVPDLGQTQVLSENLLTARGNTEELKGLSYDSGATTVLDESMLKPAPKIEKNPKSRTPKKKKGGARVLLLLIAALVVGLLGIYLYREHQARRYSEEIRSFLQSEMAANGDKIAVYDDTKGRYVKEHLHTDGLLASAPEEIGAVLTITKGEEKTLHAVLCYTEDGAEIAAADFQNGTATDMLETWCGEELNAYREHLEIRDYFAGNPEITGEKLAFMDQESGRFSFREDYLPEALQTQSVQELCGYYSYSVKREELSGLYGVGLEVKGTGDALNVTLFDAAGNAFGKREFHSSAPSTVSMGGSFHAEVEPATVQNWLKTVTEEMHFHVSFASKLREEAMGEGKLLVSYDEKEARYGTRYIPATLRADDPAQVALLVSYNSRMESIKASYGFLKNRSTITGQEEVLQIRLIDPRDGKVVVQETIHAGQPEKVSADATTFTNWVSDYSVQFWVKKQANNYWYDNLARKIVEKEPHDGEVLVVYDEGTERYLEEYSPSELREDGVIRAVAVIKPPVWQTKWVQYGGIYYNTRSVSGRVEQRSITITDLATGRTIAQGTLLAEVPQSINEADTTFTAKVSDAEIKSWIKENWERYLG